MPELPEVETIRAGLKACLTDRHFIDIRLRRKKLRYDIPKHLKSTLQNQKIIAFRRRAKYLLIDFNGDITLLIHLGMSGQLRVYSHSCLAKRSQEATLKVQKPALIERAKISLLENLEAISVFKQHDHIIFLTDQKQLLIYHDPRRFGFVALLETKQLKESRWLRALGPEPLQESFHTDYLIKALSLRKTPLKTALLDQRLVAGLGNIYVCEALFRARISPYRLAASLTGKEAERLVREIQAVLSEAIKAGGSSIKDYRLSNGDSGYFQHAFRVYNREAEPCPEKTCSAKIVREVQSGRSTYFCPTCQER